MRIPSTYNVSNPYFFVPRLSTAFTTSPLPSFPPPFPHYLPPFLLIFFLTNTFFFSFPNGVYSFISFIDPIMLSERFFLSFSPFSPFFLFFFLLFSLYCFFSCVMSPSYPCPNPTLNGMLLVRIKYQYFNIQIFNVRYPIFGARYLLIIAPVYIHVYYAQ